MVPKKIDELWAWICTETDGSEGVPAISMNLNGVDHMAPMIGADRDRVESYRPYVMDLVKDRPELKFKLVRFGCKEIFEHV